MLIVYLIVGLVCYLHFGEELLNFNYGNILLIFNLRSQVALIVNILAILYLCLSNITKYQPTKNILTILIRDKFRDSSLWNALSIFAMHLINTFVANYLISKDIKLHRIIYILGLFSPILSFFIPFYSFLKVFQLSAYMKNYKKLFLVVFWLVLAFWVASCLNFIAELLI